MSPAVRRALPMTFVVYVVEALLAAGLGAWVDARFGSLARAAPAQLAVERARRLAQLAENAAPLWDLLTFALPLYALLLLALRPLLTMAWCSSLANTESIAHAVGNARRLYGRSAMINVWLGAVAIIPATGLAATTALGPFAALSLESGSRTAICAGSLATLWALHLLHDLAQAHCRSQLAKPSMLLAARQLLRPRLWASATAWHAAATVISGVFAYLAFASSKGPGLTWAALPLLQVAAFSRLILRSGWLAACLEHAAKAPPNPGR